MPESFFKTSDGEWFAPTDHCRGPWHEEHCHAGPPTGLLARRMELVCPQQRLSRLTVNLFRPIPFAGFRVTATPQRQGRTVSLVSAEITDAEERCCVRAEGLFMTPQPLQDLPTVSAPMGRIEDASPGAFPINEMLHPLPAFNGNGVETRYPPGHGPTPGPTRAWLKTVPLLADETPSPFQRLCPMADCGNAFSRNAEPDEVNFLNTDLTIALFRDPQGEWLGSESTGYWEPNGIGLADALLFDNHGVVGRALQTLLLRPASRV